MTGAVVATRPGWWPGEHHHAPNFLGASDAIGVYWSLAYELAFYIAMSALFVLGLHKRSVWLSLTGSIVCFGFATGMHVVLHRSAPLAIFCLATMFTGAVFFRWTDGVTRSRTLVTCVVVAQAAGPVVLWTALSGHEDPAFFGARSFTPMSSAWVGAYLLFIAGIWGWRSSAPKVLRGLGLISYSIYLMQGVIFTAINISRFGLWAGLVWVPAIIAMSVVAYSLVEQPTINFGRRLARRMPSSLPQCEPTEPELALRS